MGEKVGSNGQENDITKLQDEIDADAEKYTKEHEDLLKKKKLAEEEFKKQIDKLADDQKVELEAIRAKYSEKMLKDATRYQTMQK